MSGDRFPAAESFIGDSKGQQVFIGVSPFEGDPTDLIGNNKKVMFSSTFRIKINEKGEFQFVVSQGKQYTIDEWNTIIMAKPVEAGNSNGNPVKFDGGGFGGAGSGGTWEINRQSSGVRSPVDLRTD